MSEPTVVPFPRGPAAPAHLSAAEAETWKAVIGAGGLCWRLIGVRRVQGISVLRSSQ